MKKIYPIIIITLIIIFTILTVSNHSIKNIYKAKVCYIEETNLVSSIISKGIIEEVEKEELFTDLPLRVVEANIKEGEKVEKGEILIKLDLSNIESQLETAKLNADMEEVLLKKIKDGNNINKDKTEKYEIDSLYKNNYSPMNFKEQVEIQKKNLEIAKIKLDEIKKKVDKQDKYLESPIDGIVTHLEVKEGEFTEIGKPIVVISNLNKLQVRLNVEESYVSQLKVGQEVKINPKALEDNEYNGFVKYIAPIADNHNSEVIVEVLVDIIDADKKLKPGYSVEAKIITKTKSGVLTIPYEAILQDEDGKDYVYIIDSNVASKQYIKTGCEMDFEAEVIDGLSNKDILIINPKEGLKGKPVKIEKIKKVSN